MTINATCKLKNDVKGTQTVDHTCKKINLQTFYTNNINQNDSIENLHSCVILNQEKSYTVSTIFFFWILFTKSKQIYQTK